MVADEMRERFVELDTDDRSARQIAAILGVSQQTIHRWRVALGRRRAPATVPYSPEVRERALRLIEDGCSISEAARTVGAARPVVAGWFPDAPRYTKSQAGEASALARLEREVLHPVPTDRRKK